MVAATKELPRLQQQFKEHVAPEAMKRFELRNQHQLPALSKIVINCGIGRFLENQKLKPEIRDTVFNALREHDSVRIPDGAGEPLP